MALPQTASHIEQHRLISDCELPFTVWTLHSQNNNNNNNNNKEEDILLADPCPDWSSTYGAAHWHVYMSLEPRVAWPTPRAWNPCKWYTDASSYAIAWLHCTVGNISHTVTHSVRCCTIPVHTLAHSPKQEHAHAQTRRHALTNAHMHTHTHTHTRTHSCTRTHTHSCTHAQTYSDTLSALSMWNDTQFWHSRM